MKLGSLATLSSVLLALGSLSVGLAACGNSVAGGNGPDSDAGDAEISIELTPPSVSLEVVNGQQAEQVYKVIATLASGETVDVTAESALAIDDSTLGNFSDAVFRTSGVTGGSSTLRAVYSGQSASAAITIAVKSDRLDEGVQADAADLFDAASVDPALALNLVYPPTQVYMPPNLGDFEAHWTSPAGINLFEVSLSTEFSTTRLFTTRDASAGAFAVFTPEEWAVVGESGRGRDVIVRVRGLNSAAPATLGSSNLGVVHLTNTDVEGGIYYWAAAGALPGGIYRHDMSRPGEAAEAYYTTGESPSGRCVACHVISRAGDLMAITYDGGDGAASIVDVATRQPLLATDGTLRWNFAAFEPSGARIVGVYRGAMTLRDVASGTVINTVPTGGYVSHVDFSPLGDKIVYVAVASPTADWNFTGGSLIVQDFDAGSAMWGTAMTLHQPPAGANAYYPSFSPDGQWVLFNQSTAGSYDAASAELYVMPTDASAAPIRLDSPNLQSGLTNSWARWAPFEQVLRPNNGEFAEPFFWLTFSSKRAFGVRLAGGSPQLWMTPFFPERAAAGNDPAAPAFRLPFQELTTNNHIAQWTTKVIAVD